MGGGEMGSMGSKDLLEKEAEKRRGPLLLVLDELRRHGTFTLSAPVALLSGSTVEAVPVSALANRVPCSSALSHPLIARFRDVEREQGWDAAWDALATDDEDGELFCALWDECVAQQGRAKWTTDDVVEVIDTLKGEMEKGDPGLVVVWDRPGESVLWGVLKFG